MTIEQSLISLNSFPIPTLFIEKVGVDRNLIISNEYTKAISTTQNYRLATADVYMYLHGQPSITEQDVGVNQLGGIKDDFLSFANSIYLEYGDPKYTGRGTFGYIGEYLDG